MRVKQLDSRQQPVKSVRFEPQEFGWSKEYRPGQTICTGLRESGERSIGRMVRSVNETQRTA